MQTHSLKSRSTCPEYQDLDNSFLNDLGKLSPAQMYRELVMSVAGTPLPVYVGRCFLGSKDPTTLYSFLQMVTPEYKYRDAKKG